MTNSPLQLAAWIAGLLIAAMATKWLVSTPPETVSGMARIIDGDSLRIGGHEIRLKGIDAPEGRQTCQKNGASWPCGEQARASLKAMIDGSTVVCRWQERDQHQRLLAQCLVQDRDLNAAMVAEGWAVAFGARYIAEERRAKDARRGMWAGEFERPGEWRRRQGVGR